MDVVQNEGPFSIVLRTAWGGSWRRFSQPHHVVIAREPARVPDALAEVDAAVRDGSYAAGFVTYEAAAGFGLPVREPDTRLPLVCFGLFNEHGIENLARLPPASAGALGEWTPSVDHDQYMRAIGEIKDRIAAGDTYQINYTFRLTAPFSGDPAAIMHDLQAAQAGHWSAYIDLGDYVICSASPELFFNLEGARLTCRPMKGTWPRGFWPAQDAERGKELRRSAKNRAENVMIVDMTRNDLGRVAETGSVRPVSLFDVERYPLQWQMTSTVEASAEDPSLVTLFAGMFPCGSITGAPKHSSMGVIRELESTPRGIYTGAIGYLSPGGRGHFNVAIRTVVFDRGAGRAEFGVGSGVVWDSVDLDEYEECLLKARMLGAARVASGGAASYVVADPPGFQLLEALLWTPARGFVRIDAHLTRLRGSAECFGFLCDTAEIRSLLNAAVEDLRGPAKLRILLEHDGSVLCEAIDLLRLKEPRRIALAAEPVDRHDVFLYHKTTNRGVYERARASRPEADAVILWNDVGEVADATDSNVVIRRGGVKITPPIECGLLPGIERAKLLASGEIVESRITKAELERAEEIWLINSVRGWMKAEL